MGEKSRKLKDQLLDSLQISCTLINTLSIAIKHIESIETKYKALVELSDELLKKCTDLETEKESLNKDIKDLQLKVEELTHDLSTSVKSERSLNKSFDELLTRYNEIIQSIAYTNQQDKNKAYL